LCDNVIQLGEIPNPNELRMISDIDLEKNWEKRIEDIDKDMKIVVKCNSCNRLHIFWDGFENPQTVYSIDQTGI
jgi:hypothetical protein